MIRNIVSDSLLLEATPNNDYVVKIPALSPAKCIIPDTMALIFRFSNSNTKSWFKNNLGRLLMDKLIISIQSEVAYSNNGESIIEIYKDLWRSEEDRENRSRYEIANENVRKLISKDDSANKAAKTDGVLDLSVANRCDRMKIPLGKILCDNGPYAPYGMCDFEYRISLPSA